MEHYYRWKDVPQHHLRTKTQWAKDNYRLKPGARPEAVFKGEYGEYKLYDRGEVEDMIPGGIRF